jgi:5-methylcytosine-specific restriction endonuclease McrA
MNMEYSKEELIEAYEIGGSYAKAAKLLNLSSGKFRYYYLLVLDKCTKCGFDKEEIKSTRCNSCLEKQRLVFIEETKKCLTCDNILVKTLNLSKSWHNLKYCSECKKKICVINTQNYNKKHPETKLKSRIISSKRRALKRSTTSKNINKYIENLFIITKSCYYCPSNVNLTIEHKTPLSRGGTHTEDNIVLACAKCNFKKHTKTEQEFRNTMGGGLSHALL